MFAKVPTAEDTTAIPVALHIPGWTDDYIARMPELLNIRENIRGDFLAAAAHRAALIPQNAYLVAMQKSDYCWGSNMTLLNNGILLILGFLLTGNNEYREAALSSLHYLLGRNATGSSQVCAVRQVLQWYPRRWELLQTPDLYRRKGNQIHQQPHIPVRFWLYAYAVATPATADFAAVTALAARIFAPYDNDFSEKLKAASLLSWEFLQTHPEFIAFSNPPGSSFVDGSSKRAAGAVWQQPCTNLPAYAASSAQPQRWK